MTEAELDDALSSPRAETEAALVSCPGDVVVLGAGGKMGPTLARMARRAAGDSRRVMAVSRWSSAEARRQLEEAGVETVSADLWPDEDGAARIKSRITSLTALVRQRLGTEAWRLRRTGPRFTFILLEGDRVLTT